MVVRMDCLFCKIANKEEEANILYEDDLVVMILDAYPTVDGHCLIIPKKHYETYLDIPDDLILHINKVAKEQAPTLLKKLYKNSVSLLVNYGDSQLIKHYHLHVLPNYGLDDNVKYTKEEILNMLKDE